MTDTVEAIMALAETYVDEEVYCDRLLADKARAALRAAVEQIVRERDAERDGRDAMDSAARCNHKAYEQEREARLRAEQDAARYRWLRKPGCPLLVVKPSSAYGDLQMDELTLDRAIDAAMKEGK